MVMRGGGLGLAILGVGLAVSPTASAQQFSCPPDRRNETIDGSLEVRGYCFIEKSTINGDVQVFKGGMIHIKSTYIDGSLIMDASDNLPIFLRLSDLLINQDLIVDGRNAGYVEVDVLNSSIEGDLKAQDIIRLLVFDVSIGGMLDVEFVENGTFIEKNDVDRNIRIFRAGRDVSVEDNKTSGDTVIIRTMSAASVRDNVIGGDLICLDNSRVLSEGNVVHGSKVGQCAGD
jgi:hypothetical protein